MDSKAYQINRLSDEQKQSPLEVLTSFFTEMTLQEVRDTLEDFAWLAVKVEDAAPHYRGDALFVVKKLEEVLEAAYLLQQNPK